MKCPSFTPRTLRILIPGKPIAKARPRFYRRGNFVGTYNVQETEEGRWMLEAKAQLPADWSPIQSAVKMECIFCMPIPKSMPKKLREQCNETGWPPHIKKPDLDNLVKFVKDCLRGLAYQDDAQIMSLWARKYYNSAPGTVINIREWAKEESDG